MKKSIFLILFIPLLVGCNTSDPDTTILSGVAENSESFLILRSAETGERDTIKVLEDGSFQHVIDSLKDPSSYYLLLDKEYYLNLYITPGQELVVSFDREDLEGSLQFTGEGADMNSYLAAMDFFTDSVPPNREKWMLDIAEFQENIDNYRELKMKILETADKNDESDPFWDIQEAEILYAWASDMNTYPRAYSYYNDGAELPDEYYAFRDSIDINRPEYLGSFNFRQYVTAFANAGINEMMAVNPPEDITYFMLEKSAEIIQDQEVLDYFRVEQMINMMGYYDLADISNSIEFIQVNVKDEDLMARFNKEYNAWMKLSEGSPGIDFTGKDIEGTEVHFSDFRGKYVYVDVWATWCAPCRNEIPHLKTMEEDYHDRNIVFLSYSIDESHEDWEQFVKEEQLGGVQIYGEKAWQSELAVYYKIRGIPRFMLFDPDGNIVSVNMTRPSDEKTREKFDNLANL